MFTADQLVAHAVGDYILQSHWMATEKVRDKFAALIHAITYTIPFAFITSSLYALAFILVTHFFIDHYRLARWVVWFKNNHGFPFLRFRYRENHRYYTKWTRASITSTGFPLDCPPFLAVWLLIIVDNILHVLCNGFAIWMWG